MRKIFDDDLTFLVEADKVSRFFDLLIEFVESVTEVPRWRLYIAFAFLGKKATKNLLKLKDY